MKLQQLKPKIALENFFTIAGFEVNEASAFNKTFNISLNQTYLNKPSPVKWEGIYGEIPLSIDNMITGICLWDSRWKIEFLNKKKVSQPGAVKVLALENTRNDAISFIKEGRQIKNITIPRNLGRYHNYYLEWLSSSVKKLNIRHIFMHIPITEYHFYISELEVQMQKALPELHDHLEVFGNSLKAKAKEIMESANVRHTIIDPMKQYNVRNPIESYKFTYNQLPVIHPKENFFAFEDISEFKLVSGSPVKNGIFAVFDNPDPYAIKTTNEKNSITLPFLH